MCVRTASAGLAFTRLGQIRSATVTLGVGRTHRMRLEGKVAIITGAATGIGKGIAQRFAQEGAAVAVDYVGTPDAASEVLQAIEHAGGRALTVNADVSQAGEVQQLIDQTVQKWGRLDIF